MRLQLLVRRSRLGKLGLCASVLHAASLLERCYRAGLGGSASNLSHTIAPSWLQLTARKRRVASPWGRQAPGSACDRLLPPPGRVAEPQRRAALTLPQPRERRGERFYEHARHPAHVRRPANHLYGLVRGEGSAVVRYGEPLRGAAPGSEPKSGTTPPSPRSRRYGSPMRVDHSVNHDAPGLRRTERVLRYRTPEPRLWGRFSPDLDGQMIQTDK